MKRHSIFLLFGAALICSTFASAAPSSHNAVLKSATPTQAPVFTSAAIARDWGDAQQNAGHFELASEAYLEEAELRIKLHDLQGAEVERRRAWRMRTSVVIGVPVAVAPSEPSSLAKLEPASGCLIGTLDTPTEGRTFPGESVADDFESRIGKPVAVAFRYIRYGDSFPFAWAHLQAKKGRAIELAMEPSNIYDVADDEYLEGFAADLNQSGASCFLRFGGEMNGAWTPWGKDPDAYKHAFRTVHDVMAHFAPRCAMVWAPNMIPLEDVDKYYPGDDVVDWVGLSFYMVKYYDDKLSEPGWQDHPSVFLNPFYEKYAQKKPMCLVECGVSRESHVEGKPCDEYAAARIQDLLSAIKLRYPRIKMMCWFDRNNLNGVDVDRRLNDYSLPPGSEALAAFKTAVADPYFLSKVPSDNDPLVAYETMTGIPEGYTGPVSLSISTYCLNPTVVVTRDGQSAIVTRPYDFVVPEGTGPVTLTVKDDEGRVAKTISLPAPAANYLASAP